MTAFREDKVLGQIVEALRGLGGMATLEQIEGQVSRSGALHLPPDALEAVIQLTVRANRDGRGLGCFSQYDDELIVLSTRRASALTPGSIDRVSSSAADRPGSRTL